MAARKSRLAELLKDLPDQPSPRLVASQRCGRQGGLARAARHGELELTAWGEIAGAGTLARYGRAYYKHNGRLGGLARAERYGLGRFRKNKKVS